MPVLRFAPAAAAGELRDESGENFLLPPLIRLHLLRAIPSRPAVRRRRRRRRRRARYHNVTTRDSLALLLKVKIPVGAGAILRRASLQATLILPIHPPLSRLTSSPSPFLPSRSFDFAFFYPPFFCKLVQTFIGAILCVHNGRTGSNRV